MKRRAIAFGRASRLPCSAFFDERCTVPVLCKGNCRYWATGPFVGCAVPRTTSLRAIHRGPATVMTSRRRDVGVVAPIGIGNGNVDVLIRTPSLPRSALQKTTVGERKPVIELPGAWPGRRHVDG